MNEKVKNTCDLILENREALIKKMTWEADPNAYALMAGFLTAANGIHADPEKYQACKDIIKKNAGIFSEMRGLAGAVVAAKMMMADDPEAYVKGVIEVYNKLGKIHKLMGSPYMVMTAINIFEHNGVDGADVDIERLESIFNELHKKHPLLVSDADRGYLSMIATSEMDASGISQRIEDVYESCKKMSIDKNAVYSMAQMLAFSDKTAEEKMNFVDEMIKGLDAAGTPIDKGQGLAVLGALSLLDIPKEQLISDIADASNYLNGKNGFKWYDEGKRMRTVYAALAVFLTYAKDNASLGSAISSNIAMTIAEEIILLIIIIAVSTTVSIAASH